MTKDADVLRQDMQSDSELLLALVPPDHARAAVEIINRLNRNYSALATLRAQEATQRAVDEWLAKQR